MTQKEIYTLRKSELNRTRDRYKEVITPKETDPEKMWEYHGQIFSSHRPTIDDREAFIACMLLIYFPLSLFEGKRCRNHFNSTLAKIYEVSRPAVSIWLGEVRVRYLHNHRDLQHRAQDMYDLLVQL